MTENDADNDTDDADDDTDDADDADNDTDDDDNAMAGNVGPSLRQKERKCRSHFPANNLRCICTLGDGGDDDELE